jgi:hypothetical protein
MRTARQPASSAAIAGLCSSTLGRPSVFEQPARLLMQDARVMRLGCPPLGCLLQPFQAAPRMGAVAVLPGRERHIPS